MTKTKTPTAPKKNAVLDEEPKQPKKGQLTIKNPFNVPEPQFAEDKNKEPAQAYQPSHDPNSGLHAGESEYDAIARIYRRIWGELIPGRSKYDASIREIRDAYEGIVKEAQNPSSEQKVFPLVFMFVDAKLSIVLSNKPRAVFEHDRDHKKIPFIEDAYNTVCEDLGDGLNIDTVDHLWHLYNELYGWSIKRVWFEVDSEVKYEPSPARDEGGNEIYSKDGFVQLEYRRTLTRTGRVKHRVYEPEMVAVDPAPRVMFLSQAMDIVFYGDIHYDEFVQQYKSNPTYQNAEFVNPGAYFNPFPTEQTTGTDPSGNAALYGTSAAGLLRNRVRIEEYYNKARNEYMLRANNIPLLHVPNPTPGNQLPAADLHDRIRPASFYSRGEGHVAEVLISIYQKLMNAKARRAQLSAAPVVLTDQASGVSPKSFKVYPGAHWRGMKGKVEVLDLSGVDTGEATEYVTEIRNLAKVTLGVDHDRLIAAPDPTAAQQAARDASALIRTEKDTKLNENNGHVRSMDLTVQNIQDWMTIPDLAQISTLDDEDLAELKDYDKIDKDTYRKYPKIRTTGRRYTESFDETAQSFSLNGGKKPGEPDGFIYARPSFLKTRGKVRVKAISDRKQTLNRQQKIEAAQELLANAFGLPPKNQDAIAKAQQDAQQKMATAQPGAQTPQPPAEIPEPEYYINRAKAVERFIESIGEDIDELTAGEGNTADKPATAMVQKFMKLQQTLSPKGTPPAADPTDLTQNFLKKYKKNETKFLPTADAPK